MTRMSVITAEVTSKKQLVDDTCVYNTNLGMSQDSEETAGSFKARPSGQGADVRKPQPAPDVREPRPAQEVREPQPAPGVTDSSYSQPVPDPSHSMHVPVSMVPSSDLSIVPSHSSDPSSVPGNAKNLSRRFPNTKGHQQASPDICHGRLRAPDDGGWDEHPAAVLRDHHHCTG